MERTLAEALPIVGGAALAAVLFGYVVFRGVFRVWRTTFAVEARRRGRWAWRAAIAAVGGLTALTTIRLDPAVETDVQHVLVLVLIGGLTWLAIALLRAGELSAMDRFDVSVSDNLRARSKRTKYVVLRRVGSALAVIVGLATALLTFPSARALGASLLASAGLAGLVLGVAAQNTLKNLVAGIQIAFAEPIRLDDAVIVQDEWGWIEDITLTTVVVRTWDRRRLIYPTAWFTEHPFQNWTRKDAQLLGQVVLPLDHRTDVAGLRAAAAEIVESSPHWDGVFHNLQVVEATTEGIDVRVLMTAVDGPTAWELRCDVRERLISWLVANDPRALPVTRLVRNSGTSDEPHRRRDDPASELWGREESEPTPPAHGDVRGGQSLTELDDRPDPA